MHDPLSPEFPDNRLLNLTAPFDQRGACLLVDNMLPGMDGLALLDRLRAKEIRLPAIMLTGHGDAALAVAAMKAGVVDLIEKPTSAAHLLASVRGAIKAGVTVHPSGETRKAAPSRFAKLTKRERDVLAQVLDGSPNKIIAVNLGINQRTVENHRASVMRKTKAASLPDLVRIALLADLPSI